MKSARDRMTIIAIYENVGTYRPTAAICGTTPKTVKRVIDRAGAGDTLRRRKERRRNYEDVADLVAERVQRSKGWISAKRLLPAARTAGYTVRTATSVVSSRRRRRTGVGRIIGVVARRCGPRVSIWSSTGA